jgi:hypothetical protein
MNKSKVCGIILSDGSIVKMWNDEGGKLSDIFISDDTPTSQLSPDVVTYYAEIQCGFDLNGNLSRIYIEPLGEVLEPTEEPLEPSIDLKQHGCDLLAPRTRTVSDEEYHSIAEGFTE